MDNITNKIYNAIIGQINTVDDKIVYINGTKYTIPHYKEIKRAALNIVLVLKGGRLSYRIDLGKELNNIIISVINSLTDSLMTIAIIPKEPLIFLRSNKFLIDMVFQKEKDINEAFGKVLEYEYVECGVIKNIKKLYTINYEATGESNEVIKLYAFDIPIDKYVDEVINKVTNKTTLYSNILHEYGYTVNSRISTF